MPKMVKLEINPKYKPETPEDRAALKAVKASLKSRSVAHVTAEENIRNSKGMLRIAPEDAGPPPPELNLDDMPTDQLKIMLLTVGVTPKKKQMTREEIIFVIRQKLSLIEVPGDED